MSDIDNNKWNDKKREIPLHPKIMEKPLIEKDRYKDFDDLNPPHRDRSGCRQSLGFFVWMTASLVFFLIMFLYWLKWR